jgi:hypothetical protein
MNFALQLNLEQKKLDQFCKKRRFSNKLVGLHMSQIGGSERNSAQIALDDVEFLSILQLVLSACAVRKSSFMRNLIRDT